GGFLGDVIGYFVSVWMSHLEVGSARHMGRTGTMLVSFQPQIYVRGFLLAFMASAVASVLPARAAAKLSPIQIIRSAEG
ncbi:MAG: ABC transporter permease, partial [Bdellovibrionales bacterium]|nr:ABC transporter permease [Bdellovibrionales bacterium]